MRKIVWEPVDAPSPRQRPDRRSLRGRRQLSEWYLSSCPSLLVGAASPSLAHSPRTSISAGRFITPAQRSCGCESGGVSTINGGSAYHCSIRWPPVRLLPRLNKLQVIEYAPGRNGSAGTRSTIS